MSTERWILFDMDGVVTSEDGYRRATGCALLDFAAHLGHDGAWSAVFAADADALPWRIEPDLHAHAAAQNASLNTNWDQCHVAALEMLWRLIAHEPANLDRLLTVNWESNELCEPLTWPPLNPDMGGLMPGAIARGDRLRGFDLMDRLAASLGPAGPLAVRKGPIWQWLFRQFQGWFTGAAVVSNGWFPRRKGIIHDEKLIMEPGILSEMFRSLKKAGWKLGIATGRPRGELIPTLTRFDLLGAFEPNAITTHDEIARAEEELAVAGVTAHLSKPHPFPFLRSLHPTASASELASWTRLSLDRGQVIVVGDTVGDMAAAAAIGAVPVGVLTGPAGEQARETLTKASARHVIRDVTLLPDLLAGL